MLTRRGSASETKHMTGLAMYSDSGIGSMSRALYSVINCMFHSLTVAYSAFNELPLGLIGENVKGHHSVALALWPTRCKLGKSRLKATAAGNPVFSGPWGQCDCLPNKSGQAHGMCPIDKTSRPSVDVMRFWGRQPDSASSCQWVQFANVISPFQPRQ